MDIAANILKEHLKNVYFISGGPYGGKTTMAKLIEEKYGLCRYRQDDHFDNYAAIATPEYQPAMSLDRSKDWQGYFSQPPEKYHKWLTESMRDEAGFAIIDLIKLSAHQKVIADVMIPVDILTEIADYSQVVLLFAPVEMVREHYFNREDKQQMLRFIKTLPNPDYLIENSLDAVTYRGREEIQEFYDSGFRCIKRTDHDTVEKTFKLIEEHFGLSKS